MEKNQDTNTVFSRPRRDIRRQPADPGAEPLSTFFFLKFDEPPGLIEETGAREADSVRHGLFLRGTGTVVLLFCSRFSLIFWGILKYTSIPTKMKKETVTQKVASIVINIYLYFFLKYHLQSL